MPFLLRVLYIALKDDVGGNGEDEIRFFPSL